MRKSAIRLLALATFSLALVGAPVITAVYAAPDSDAPAPAPAPTKGKKKKSSEASPTQDYAKFSDGYRAAYTTIYDRHDYAGAIDQLKALGHDDTAGRRQSDRLFLPKARRLQARAKSGTSVR